MESTGKRDGTRRRVERRRGERRLANLPERLQLELDGVARAPLKRRSRGGKRAGAGRKRAPGVRPSVPHRTRAAHHTAHPVLITLRARPGLPSLRAQRVSDMLRAVLRRQRTRRYASTFHVVEFTIQDNHLHLIIEATGGAAIAKSALRTGVSGLVISFAKQLNKLLGRRRGKVWGDRYHSRELASPTEVRNAIVYVFRNLARHGTTMLGDGNVDRFSSAPRFAHFTRPVVAFDDEPWPATVPRTWLLGSGWWTRTRQGLLDPNEIRRRGA